MHTVKIQPKGLTLSVNTDETVLAAAIRQGYTFPYGCDNGACHACEGKLLAGTVRLKSSGQVISAPDNTNSQRQNENSGQINNQQIVNTLFCLAFPQTDLVIEVKKVLAPNEMPLRKVASQIKSVTPLSRDVKCIKLLLPAGKKIAYLPGQYLELILRKNGKSAFSIANAPGSREIELHIRYTPDGGSCDEIIDLLKNETILNIELPKGNCILKEENNNTLIFLAGSTGFAPFKAMLEQAFIDGRKQQMYLYWGGRIVEDIYLHDLAMKWEQKHPNFHYVPVVSEPETQANWHGRTGMVHTAVLEDFKDLSAAIEVYAGGSPGMVYAALDAFKEKGLPEAQMYSDVFTYAPRP